MASWTNGVNSNAENSNLENSNAVSNPGSNSYSEEDYYDIGMLNHEEVITNKDMKYIVLQGLLFHKDSDPFININRTITDIKQQIKILQSIDPRCVPLGEISITKNGYYQSMLIPKTMIKPIVKTNKQYENDFDIEVTNARSRKSGNNSTRKINRKGFLRNINNRRVNANGVIITDEGKPTLTWPRYYRPQNDENLEDNQKESINKSYEDRYNIYKDSYDELNADGTQETYVVISGRGDDTIKDLESRISSIISYIPCTLFSGIYFDQYNYPAQGLYIPDIILKKLLAKDKEEANAVAKGRAAAAAAKAATNAAAKAATNAARAAKAATNAAIARNLEAEEEAKRVNAAAKNTNTTRLLPSVTRKNRSWWPFGKGNKEGKKD